MKPLDPIAVCEPAITVAFERPAALAGAVVEVVGEQAQHDPDAGESRHDVAVASVATPDQPALHVAEGRLHAADELGGPSPVAGARVVDLVGHAANLPAGAARPAPAAGGFVQSSKDEQTPPDVTAVANWYGSSRMVADVIGDEVGDRSLAIVPFAGGMAEIQHIRTAKIVVNDKHRHVVNLARTIADRSRGPRLYRRLRREIFHPDTLAAAQAFCRDVDAGQAAAAGGGLFAPAPRVVDADEWAFQYAIATWMGRGGRGGRRDEFGGALPVRYSTGGGGSAQRFHNWVRGIPSWRRIFGRFEACEFTTEDAFELLARLDEFDNRLVVYVDSPWPDAGDVYSHPFGIAQHRRLAAELARFKNGAFDNGTRVVVRFADHPLVRELYPEGDGWTWVRYGNRGQKNRAFDEVLLINGPSYTAGRAA